CPKNKEKFKGFFKRRNTNARAGRSPGARTASGTTPWLPDPKTLKFVFVIVAVLLLVSTRRGPWLGKSAPGAGNGEGDTAGTLGPGRLGQGVPGQDYPVIGVGKIGVPWLGRSDPALSREARTALSCPGVSSRINGGRESRWKLRNESQEATARLPLSLVS
uniref:Uncharacterized protein n=1 Tax=Theropithecus gelada TaxID=9565 RepID=A0A8D2E0J5_THEGE